MKIKSIKSLKNLKGKKVLLRVDFNVPVKTGRIVNDYKIIKSLPTIQYLVKGGAKVVILSHLGRPKGIDKTLSLKPVAKKLDSLIKRKISFFSLEKNDWEGCAASVNGLKNGEIMLLENIRFLKGEENNDPVLSEKLSKLGDLFVLDGFAVTHRSAASVSGLQKFLPSYAGLLLTDEISVLIKAVKNPKRPLVVLLGGAKAETKIPVLKHLLQSADKILLGGGIYNTYLYEKGIKIGDSLVSPEFGKEIVKYCRNKKIVLPVDVVVGKKTGQEAKIIPVQDLNVAKGQAVFDIGPATVRMFSAEMEKGRTIIWNGALGMFEQKPYQFGTFSLASVLASLSKGQALGVCGGGETIEILEKLKLMDEIDLVSTGGGAMLEFLSGKKLPGVEPLLKK